jgi:O-antigen/teichoic acid export membrane protein
MDARPAPGQELNWIILGAALLNIALAIVFGPKYGALGIAASLVAAEGSMAIATLVTLRIRKLDPWRAPVEVTA